MKLLSDYTFLHSVGRCIRHQADGEPDLAGLLQFATQLVFAETIAFSKVDGSEIISENHDILLALRESGIDETVLSFAKLTRDDFCASSIHAAELLATDLQFVLPNNQLAPHSLLPTARPNLGSKIMQYENRIHEVLLSGSDESRHELIKESLLPAYLGSAMYMLQSDNLWNSIQQIVAKGNWSKMETEYLSMYLRYYLNCQLACKTGQNENVSCEYAPSVSRSRLIDTYSSYVITRLSESVGQAAKALEPVSLGAPSIAEALVLKSKGDPVGLISEALSAREKAKELRGLLRSIYDRRTGDEYTSVPINEIRETILTLSKTLRQDLGIEERPEWRHALEFQFVGFVPIPSIKKDINKLIDWIVFKKNQKMVTVLSEFAKTLANCTAGRDRFAYQKLEANVRKNL